MPSDTLVILCSYNEAGNIARLVRDLTRADSATHMVIIDDNSPDGTGQIADELAAKLDTVKVIHRPRKLGLGSAHILGLDRAIEGGYRTAVTMDCDYTHNPEDVGKLLAALDERGADIAAGSRYSHPDGIHDWPLWRKVVTRTAHLCTVALLGMPFDATSAFRAYRTDALRRVRYREIRGDGYSFIFEMLFACLGAGLQVVEVPLQMPIRQAGQSKISRVEIVRAVLTLARLTQVRLAARRKS